MRGKAEFDAKSEQGYTLVELMVVFTLIGIMSVISMTSLLAYNKSSGHRGAARETVALLRNAQVKAVSEARTWECRFTASKLELHSPSGVEKTFNLSSNLRYVTAGPARGFTHGGTSGNSNCFLYAKGSATPGSVAVRRVDTSDDRVAVLEALTARVSYCADPTPSNPCATP